MRYLEVKPNAAAARFVRCYWMLEDEGPDSGVQRIVPDGRCELIFNLSRPYEVQVDGAWRSQPQGFLFGQITRPLMLRRADVAFFQDVPGPEPLDWAEPWRKEK